MTPEEALRLQGRMVRQAAAEAMLQQQRIEDVLYRDIKHLMVVHQEDFDEGWPYHFTCSYLLALYQRQN